MPYHFEIHPQYRCAVVTVSGRMSADEFLDASKELYEDPDWEDSFKTLWDLRWTTAVDLSPEDMENLVAAKAHRETERGLSGRIALLVNRDTLFGVARLFQHRGGAKGREIQVFTEEAPARAWIGLPTRTDGRD